MLCMMPFRLPVVDICGHKEVPVLFKAIVHGDFHTGVGLRGGGTEEQDCYQKADKSYAYGILHCVISAA